MVSNKTFIFFFFFYMCEIILFQMVDYYLLYVTEQNNLIILASKILSNRSVCQLNVTFSFNQGFFKILTFL